MKPPRVSRAEAWALAALALPSLWLHLYRLDWGLPNRARSLAVFGSEARIAELTPLLLELRERVYSEYRDMAVDTMSGQPEPGQPSSEALVDHGMRSQLLQPRSTDEQQVIGALSRLKQALRDKRLPFVVYGYVYLLLLGVALLGARLLGLLTLIPDISFYMLHPEQAARIYIVGRLVGASAALATTAMLYRTARPRFGWKVAALAAALFSWHPVCVISGHFIKPWIWTTLFSCALLHLCLRIAEGRSRRADYWLSGVLSGLAGGTVYFCALNWLWVPLAHGHASRWRFSRKDLGLLAASATAGAAVFFATNPQVLLQFDEIMRLAEGHNLGGLQADFLLHSVAEGFMTLPGALYLPALALTAFAVPGPFLWLLLASSGLLYGLLMGVSAHHLLPLYPALCLIAARGLAHGLETRPWRVPAALLAAAALAASLLASATWLRDAGSDNLDRAGRWISEHVPAGSSIGITCAIPNANFAVFRYPDYRLKYFPAARADLQPDTDYVVNVHFPPPAFSRTEAFQRRYRLIFALPGSRYAAMPVPLVGLAPYGATAVEVWGR